jgi:CTP:molybdopterin cytidylyltransferase MocA
VDGIAAVVLAAGAGTRLRPLTRVRPKPLCPVGDRALVDHAVARVSSLGDDVDVAANVHHGRDQLEPHLVALGVHVSLEEDQALGTAGALGLLRPWLDGRAVVVLNGDTWTDAPLVALLDGWDGERTRLLVAGRDPGGAKPSLCGALLPWAEVADLAPEPSGLWELRWAAAEEAGRLERVAVRATYADCGTPAGYLAANLAWSGGSTVVGAGADVAGGAERSVVWPGEAVGPTEQLVQAIRFGGGRTILVR